MPVAYIAYSMSPGIYSLQYDHGMYSLQYDHGMYSLQYVPWHV